MKLATNGIDAGREKEEKYKKLVSLSEAVLLKNDHFISRLANCSSLIKEEFSWLWVGFYIFEEGRDHLYLGPYQGPLACTVIPFHKGVCGAAYREQKTIIVPDVDKFPGHIACSGKSRSEIVVPIISEGKVKAVLDIDSTELSSFNEIDQKYLEKIVTLLM